MKPRKDWERRVVLDDVEADEALTLTLCVGSVENKRIDETFESIEGVFTGIDDQTWNTTSQHPGFGGVTPSTSLAAVEAESLYEALRVRKQRREGSR